MFVRDWRRIATVDKRKSDALRRHGILRALLKTPARNGDFRGKAFISP
jgi:hypothetical protein